MKKIILKDWTARGVNRVTRQLPYLPKWDLVPLGPGHVIAGCHTGSPGDPFPEGRDVGPTNIIVLFI